MPYIQKLYDICKASMTPDGPKSEEALQKVRAILDSLKPAHVGLDHVAQLARAYQRSMNGANGANANGANGANANGANANGANQTPDITYIHLHECDKFSMGIFCMSPGSVIPLHDHPRMTVLSKVLYGSLRVKAYDWVDLPASCDLSQGILVVCRVTQSATSVVVGSRLGAPESAAARPAKLVRDCQMNAPCDTTILYPNRGGNLHCFQAITPCALFDILSPPYSLEEEENGRNCSYYRRSLMTDLPVVAELRRMNRSEITWLEVTPAPSSLVIGKGEYKGPNIRR
ncbi:2-aminoethanethiol dioxygenase-like protein [Trifolium pratense]|uniref:cysteine dioxygenase n=1 Tax=Trifolium pratense TaxID=57577 RepID=A0A2K3MSL0_TRIPR|nr:2-aminoethanethiol dioxygenase-like protein [Trifolium pratense]